MALPCVKKEELAYLAGFVDGDGAISVQSGGAGKKREIVEITNTDLTVIDFVQLHWGGNIWSTRQKPHHKEVAHLRIVTKQAREFIKDLLPFLNQKLKQAELVLKWSENKKSKYITSIRLLNKRGI